MKLFHFISAALVIAVIAISVAPASAGQGCREGCPRGYVWDGCSCR